MYDDWRDARREAKRQAKEARRQIRRQMRGQFGDTLSKDDPSLIERPEDSIEERARKRVERRARQTTELFKNIFAYVALSLIVWFVWAVTGSGFPWPIFVTLVGGAAIAAQAISLYQNSNSALDRREEAIQREIEREMRRQGQSYEKPKRGLNDEPTDEAGAQAVRISEEGEMIPVDDDSAPQGKSAQEKPLRTDQTSKSGQ